MLKWTLHLSVYIYDTLVSLYDFPPSKTLYAQTGHLLLTEVLYRERFPDSFDMDWVYRQPKFLPRASAGAVIAYAIYVQKYLCGFGLALLGRLAL